MNYETPPNSVTPEGEIPSVITKVPDHLAPMPGPANLHVEKEVINAVPDEILSPNRQDHQAPMYPRFAYPENYSLLPSNLLAQGKVVDFAGYQEKRKSKRATINRGPRRAYDDDDALPPPNNVIHIAEYKNKE